MSSIIGILPFHPPNQAGVVQLALTNHETPNTSLKDELKFEMLFLSCNKYLKYLTNSYWASLIRTVRSCLKRFLNPSRNCSTRAIRSIITCWGSWLLIILKQYCSNLVSWFRETFFLCLTFSSLHLRWKSDFESYHHWKEGNSCNIFAGNRFSCIATWHRSSRMAWCR